MRVVITGASSGIGLEFARIFAEQGHSLVLVARDAQRLGRIAYELQSAHGTQVCVLQMDLAQPDAGAELFNKLAPGRVDILINNAGSGVCGAFADTDIASHRHTISLNTTALTELTWLAAVHMRAHGGGKILNVASTGAYQPGPYTAVYYATKAYVLSLTQAIRHELKKSGVGVSALCPGATATEFSKRAGKRDIKGAMSARAVALCGCKGLMKGRAVIIPGIGNKIAVFISKLLPGSVLAAIVAHIQKRLIRQ